MIFIVEYEYKHGRDKADVGRLDAVIVAESEKEAETKVNNHPILGRIITDMDFVILSLKEAEDDVVYFTYPLEENR